MRLKASHISNIAIALILLLATVLRCWKLNEIPLTNDELSAIMRAHASSLSELFEKGIKPDGHPPFIQVFLYLWMSFVGENSAWIKIPFIISGILSVFYCWRVGSKLFSHIVALLLAAFIATSQFFVMYSQIARPYAPGLLFILLFVSTGIDIIRKEKTSTFDFIKLGIWLILSAATHYFALLTAAIVAIFIWFNGGKQKNKIAITLISAFAISLSWISIFLSQIKTGGVGTWLGKPSPDFIKKFISFLFQYDLATYIIFIFLTLHLIYNLLHIPRRDWITLTLCLSLFITVFLIGYFYSVYRNPVLQFSVLIFVTPFLLLIPFYMVSKWRLRYAYGFIFLVLALNTKAIIFSREHYQLFYNQGYKASADFIRKHHGIKTIAIGNSEEYLKFYIKEDSKKVKFFTPGEINYASFGAYLDTLHLDSVLFVSCIPIDPVFSGLIKNNFQEVSDLAYGPAFDGIFLTKRRVGNQISLYPIENNNEFFHEKFIERKQNPHLITCTASMQGEGNPELVINLMDAKGNNIGYHAVSADNFHTDKNGYRRIILSLRPDEITTNWESAKVYFWNKNHEKLNISRIDISMESGNPYLYGLIENFK